MDNITHILGAVERGDPDAAGRPWPLVYAELRSLAVAQMARERSGQTLDPAALVHEAYLRRAVGPDHTSANRRHFFGAAAEAMRRILVEAARGKGRQERGGGRRREHPDLDALAAGGSDADLLDLHEALDRPAAVDPVKAKLVELRFFAGLTLPQAAECLGISASTAPPPRPKGGRAAGPAARPPQPARPPSRAGSRAPPPVTGRPDGRSRPPSGSSVGDSAGGRGGVGAGHEAPRAGDGEGSGPPERPDDRKRPTAESAAVPTR